MAPRVSMETLAKAAYWYYVQDLSQKEVARRLGTSQSNVSRLMRSARELGVAWDLDALEAVLSVTQGYPYFIQEFGEKMWTAAEYPSAGTVLTLAHYQTALDEFPKMDRHANHATTIGGIASRTANLDVKACFQVKQSQRRGRL